MLSNRYEEMAYTSYLFSGQKEKVEVSISRSSLILRVTFIFEDMKGRHFSVSLKR
jgi:hypothetical protein